MGVQLFGQFLIERGEIDGGQLWQALELMQRYNRRLGHIAVEEGFCSREDAERVRMQQRHVDRHFGDVAVEMGVLSSAQLQLILHRQEMEWLRVGEALVQLGHLPEHRLGELLSEFKIEQAPFQMGCIDVPEELEGSRIAAVVLDLLPRYCMRVALMNVRLGHGAPLERMPALAHRVRLGVYGSERLDITLAGDRDFAEHLAAGALDGDADTLEEERIADGLGEFLTIVARLAVRALGGGGEACEIGSPVPDAEPTEGSIFEMAASEGRAVLVLVAA